MKSVLQQVRNNVIVQTGLAEETMCLHLFMPGVGLNGGGDIPYRWFRKYEHGAILVLVRCLSNFESDLIAELELQLSRDHYREDHAPKA